AVGAGSRDTYRVDTPAQLAELVGRLGHATDGGFLIEELLVGEASIAGEPWGDYVSVESVVVDGHSTHVAVTGKFPLAEPFRETGMMLPATLPPDWTGRVLDTTTMALRALGVVCGVTQTELKL